MNQANDAPFAMIDSRPGRRRATRPHEVGPPGLAASGPASAAVSPRPRRGLRAVRALGFVAVVLVAASCAAAWLMDRHDPRRFDLLPNTVFKLGRAVPTSLISNVPRSSTGRFEPGKAGQSEVHRKGGPRPSMARLNTGDEATLGPFELSSIDVEEDDDPPFGAPSRTALPRGAPVVIHGLWPDAVLGRPRGLLRRPG